MQGERDVGVLASSPRHHGDDASGAAVTRDAVAGAGSAPIPPPQAALSHPAVFPTLPTVPLVTCGDVGQSSPFEGDGWARLKPEYILTRDAYMALCAARVARANAALAAGGGGGDGDGAGRDDGGVVGAGGGGGGGGGGGDAVGFKRRRGQNKGRRPDEVGLDAGLDGGVKMQLCRSIYTGRTCRYGARCRHSHDVATYLSHKPADLGPLCHVWSVRGSCPAGMSCRFGACHTDMTTGAQIPHPNAAALAAAWRPSLNVLLGPPFFALQRRRYTFFAKPITTGTTQYRDAGRAAPAPTEGADVSPLPPPVEAVMVDAAGEGEVAPGDGGSPPACMPQAMGAAHGGTGGDAAGDEPGHTSRAAWSSHGDDAQALALDRWAGVVKREVRLRDVEKRPLDLAGKVYIAPLTTVGNLPFRRIMKGQGADITCGEMALASNIVAGHTAEWALLRRHPSEDVFGVQLAGNNAYVMTQAAELLERHCHVDFVDVNMGCPIDLVCNKGMGAGMMGKTGRIRDVILSMNAVLSCPLTLKMRTGLENNLAARFAHRLVQRVRLWSLAESAAVKGDAGLPDGRPLVAAITIHGRTRQQRYSKYADWEYVREVVAAASVPSITITREVAAVDGWSNAHLARVATLPPDTGGDAPIVFNPGAAPPIPIIGNGDILSWEDWYAHLSEQGVCTNLLARGCLIKPWLPREIKERRHIDISSRERLDMLREYVAYGLEHWGSDQSGVNHTRRFLLEWMSFLHRYVPVGVVERAQPRMNDRPPAFVGRDDMETWMASPDVADWIRLSEMLLGPTEPGYKFVPKHKSNSYTVEDVFEAEAQAGAGGGAAKRARVEGSGDDDSGVEG